MISSEPAPLTTAFMSATGRRWTLILIASCICASYLVLAAGRVTELSDVSYPVLASQFLRGRVSLPVEPDSRLAGLADPLSSPYGLLDASLYRGKYYLYFGPVPAVLLFAPYRLVTGHDLPEAVAVPVFCIGGYLASCALFFLLSKRKHWAVPFWLQCAVVTLLGTGSMVYQLFARVKIYEVAIAAGFCLIMGGFLALTEACYRETSGSKFLIVAGLLFGSAVGCRPVLIIVDVVVLVALAIRARRDFASILAFMGPMVMVGIGLAWYNYVRFDSPFEFGRNYQVAGFDNASIPHNVKTSLACAGEFLFLPPRVLPEIPFLGFSQINPLPSRPGPALWTERMVGLFPAAPLTVLGFLFPLLWKRRRVTGPEDGADWILYTIYWSAVLIFVLFSAIGWVLARYLVDFAPMLSFESVVVLALWASSGEFLRGMRALRVVAVSAALYCLVLNVAVGTPRLSKILKFLHHEPVFESELARPRDLPWIGEGGPEALISLPATQHAPDERFDANAG